MRTLERKLRTVARLSLAQAKRSCSNKSNSSNNHNNKIIISNDKVDSGVAHYHETYKQLAKLDFMTATKILFTKPPKQRKFGLDFHLVQFFFACLPSLAVYLVAQYARSEMRERDALLEEKKKKDDEERAKEAAQKFVKDIESNVGPDISEVKERLNKLEEAVTGIVAQSQQSVDVKTKHQETEQSKSLAKESSIKSDQQSPSSAEKDTTSTIVPDAPHKDLQRRAENS